MVFFYYYSTEMICEVGATMHRQLEARFCSNLTSPPSVLFTFCAVFPEVQFYCIKKSQNWRFWGKNVKTLSFLFQ